MARVLHGIEKGLRLFRDNSDTEFVDVIFGSAAPGGDAGEQDDAPIGSLYVRQNGASSTLLQKIANAGNSSDWAQLSGSSGALGNWRPERVDAHTGQILAAGVTDPTAWSDNDGGFDGDDAAVGNYILDGNCALFEITAVTNATSITIAAASSPPVADDMFAVRFNLPDPNGQENQAIITYDGSACIKVADVDFQFATGINLSSGYTPGSGNPVVGDNVELAIQKLDGNNDAQDSVLGTSQGATNLGTFSGTTITDNVSVKTALQELETSHEETDQNVDDLITLSGVAENATNLGTFTGSTISDNNDVKGALQELETAHENQTTVINEIDQNVDDLITLSGRPENSTDNGTFNGTLLADGLDTKSALQRIEDLLEEMKVIEVNTITTSTVVDQVPVASVSACKWLVEAFEEATPANKKASEVYALNNGTVADDTQYAKIKVGANFNLTITVDISAGNMRLLAASSTAGVTVRVRRIQVTDI